MKADLDQLMSERELNAIVVVVNHDFSAPVAYLTGGVRITGGYVVKRAYGEPVLFVGGMETEEAAASGLEVVSYSELNYPEIAKAAYEAGEDPRLGLWDAMLQRLDITVGKVGVYGTGDVNVYIELLKQLTEKLPHIEFVGELGTTIFAKAYVTKDSDEIAHIQSVADRTSDVVRATWAFISGHRADEDEMVVSDDGTPLTIGDIKRFVRRELLDRDLEDTGMIFAQGRDAGFPHSRGNESQPLRLGQSIVFDLFPREIGGGYHHDMTRTWCLGYAPDDVRETWEQVMTALDIAVETFAVGKRTKAMQEAVLDYFEELGHPTGRSHPGTQTGYVHSLGHGVGLDIHEAPRITHMVDEDSFQVGNVITIEPGLYYPERGLGVRVEDMFVVTPSGELVSITDVPKDLILPLRG